MSETIQIEVACATADRQEVVRLRVPAGTTAIGAFEASGLLQRFPELDRARLALGIFGRAVAHEHRVEEGDRVEAYRPLRADPRVARRARVRGGR